MSDRVIEMSDWKEHRMRRLRGYEFEDIVDWAAIIEGMRDV